jgi:hypothetical protein
MPTQPTPKPPKRETVLPLLAELVSRGDGTFLLKPKVPDQELDTWITIRQAAEFLDIHRHNNLYPFLGEYLVYRRPLPARIIVSLKSALAFKQATQDPDFWENPALKERLKENVKKTMATLAARPPDSVS